MVVDGRLLDVPPLGNAGGAIASTTWCRPASTATSPCGSFPNIHQRRVRQAGQRPHEAALDLAVTVDSLATLRERVTLRSELLDGRRALKRQDDHDPTCPGPTRSRSRLTGLSGIELWSPDSPKLYTVRVTLTGETISPHSVEVTTGFRQATFELGRVLLNGDRLQIFGLNRHQLFPYTGWLPGSGSKRGTPS